MAINSGVPLARNLQEIAIAIREFAEIAEACRDDRERLKAFEEILILANAGLHGTVQFSESLLWLAGDRRSLI
ncbi:hypothetical protein Rctr71_013 [Virus Rctr71]|nr:hypothetical protein Rctr71_013 [Virus Rctr71]